jgi:aminopeptidase N
MESKATMSLHPEWETALDRVSSRERAANPDALSTTHPIVQRVTTVDQIEQAFDSITYQKGAAVIAMLEDYVGEDAWRQGVRAYIKRHSLSNTVTDDLWRAIQEAAGRPIAEIAHDFTRQPGVPLIRVEEAKVENGQTRVTLRQGEFSRDLPDKKPLRWRVPVTASAGGEAARTLVEKGSAKLVVPGDGPLVVNYGQAGYYRTLYAPPLISRLTEAFPRLRPIDQIGLLADNWELGESGYQPADVALKLVEAAPADGNSRLTTRVARILASLHRKYEGDAAHQAMLTRVASGKLSPALQRLTWIPKEDEPSTDAILRSDLIGALGRLGDAEVIAECRRRFDTDDPSAKSGPLRESILEVVAFHATADQWDRLHSAALEAKGPLVRSQLYRLLGSARDEALSRRALDLALTDEPGATTSSQIISAVAAWHPELAFDFALAHRARVDALVDASSRSRYYPRLAAASTDAAMIPKLEAYAKEHLPPSSRSSVDRVIAGIRDEVRVRENQLPQVTRWLDQRPK